MTGHRTSRPLAEMDSLRQVREHLLELGLCVCACDAAGRPVEEMAVGSEFCRALQLRGLTCLEAAAEAARRAAAEDRTVTLRAPCGCMMVGVPVHQRRRLAGLLVAGIPVREMLQDGSIERLAEQTNIDPAALGAMARQACRYGADNAERYATLLRWMIEQEHASEVSRGEIATLSANLANTYEELSLVYRISGAMKVTQHPREFLQEVCKELVEVMNISGAVAVIYARRASEDDEVVAAGSVDLNARQVRMLAATLAASRPVGGGRAIVDNKFRSTVASGLGATVRNLIAAPLGADASATGMLIGLNRRGEDFDSVDLKLINSIASQAAVFLANHRLYADLQDLLMGVLHALTATIDAKDPYTCGHSQRVALLSRRLAEACGFAPSKVQQVYLVGLLHDIGKIGVPESVLCKAGRLTDEEYELMKRHPEIGARILNGIRQLEEISAGVMTHHERPDGRGYPRGLRGQEVPMEGLIVGLADCFDAMTSNRTYRSALSLEKAVDEIRRHSGTQFHPLLVEKLLAMDLAELLEDLRHSAPSVLPVFAAGSSSPLPGVTPAEPAGAALEKESGP